MNQFNVLEFTILKIINRIAKFGKDLKEIFSSWDIDKNGFCKLNIYYNRCLQWILKKY